MIVIFKIIRVNISRLKEFTIDAHLVKCITTKVANTVKAIVDFDTTAVGTGKGITSCTLFISS
jgi:hypothetical protein